MMKIFIYPIVHQIISDFYDYALQHHDALDEITVNKKIDRLYDAMESIGRYACIHPKARLKQEWIDNGYYESISEDFHFAYFVAEDENGEDVAVIVDVCHSLLYHN